MTGIGRAGEGAAKALGAMSVTGTKGRLRRGNAPRAGVPAKADGPSCMGSGGYGFVARRLACPRTMGGYHYVLF